LKRNSKNNPVAVWHLSRGIINGFAFSPDDKNLAVVSRDGHMRIFDFEEEKLIVDFRSYYGALLCVSWSPDGKYLLTGGEDDLVSVWSFTEKHIIARCQGHNSWVTGVKFDPFVINTTPSSTSALVETTYRFGSVGQDTQLLLWDFSVNNLSRPRTMSTMITPVKRKSSKSNSSTMVTNQAVVTNQDSTDYSSDGLIVPSLPRNEVPTLQPIMTHRAHQEPLTDIAFLEDSVVTACQGGLVKVWYRPGKIPPVSIKDLQKSDDKSSTTVSDKTEKLDKNGESLTTTNSKAITIINDKSQKGDKDGSSVSGATDKSDSSKKLSDSTKNSPKQNVFFTQQNKPQ